jgi:hypothetical protein
MLYKTTQTSSYVSGKAFMSKKAQLLRYLGFGAYFSGTLASFLVCFYPEIFWERSMIKGLVVLLALVGAAVERVVSALLIRPFMYYTKLLQLQLLRNQIDERTRTRVIQALTVEYFLGKSVQEQSVK